MRPSKRQRKTIPIKQAQFTQLQRIARQEGRHLYAVVEIAFQKFISDWAIQKELTAQTGEAGK
jgi:hypothetical protein